MNTEMIMLKANANKAYTDGKEYGGEVSQWYKTERVWNCDKPRRESRLKLTLMQLLGLTARR